MGGRAEGAGAGTEHPHAERAPAAAAAGSPVDVSRVLEQLLDTDAIDVVHVHDPFAPSPGSAALRHSFALNVASFHRARRARPLDPGGPEPWWRCCSGGIDGRTASYRATEGAAGALLPGALRPDPGRALSWPSPILRGAAGGPLRIALLRRGGARRAAAARPRASAPARRARVGDRGLGGCPAGPLRAARRQAQGPPDGGPAGGRLDPEAVLRRGRHRLLRLRRGAHGPGRCLQAALANGAVPVASDLEVYTRAVGDGGQGLLFPAGDWQTLAAAAAAAGDRGRRASRGRLGREGGAGPRGAGPGRWWPTRSEEVYLRLAARDASGSDGDREQVRSASRVASWIHCDLHMHTDHSPGLRDPGRGPARDRQGAGASGDRDHRPQRDLGGARGARARRALSAASRSSSPRR